MSRLAAAPTVPAAPAARADAWADAGRRLAEARAEPNAAAPRVALAEAAARLGLPTLGRRALAPVAAAPGAPAVRAALDALPDDAWPIARAAEFLHANLDAGRAAGSVSETDATRLRDAWARIADDLLLLRAVDGQLVRGRASDATGLDWTHLADHRGAARSLAARGLRAADGMPAAVVLEGLDPPWLAQVVHRAGAEGRFGYTPRLWLVQADPRQAAAGLALADLRPVLGDGRVALLVGSDAAARLEAQLHERAASCVVDLCIANPATAARLAPTPSAIVDAAALARAERLAAAGAALAARGAARDAAWRARRWAEGTMPGAAEPLRILLVACRFTRYVRHAVLDLAAALDARGVRTSIVEESDDHARLAPLGCAEAIRAVDPDLVILPNYTRPALGNALPADVPFLCWVQDTMPHLLERGAWAASGPLDFAVGQLCRAYRAHGLAEAQSDVLPLVASPRKFHPAPPTAAQRRRFDCEIAFATRHGEAPEALEARLAAELGLRGALAEPAAHLAAAARALARLAPFVRLKPALRAALQAAVAGLDLGPRGAEVRDLLLHGYARPVLDRWIRHEVVGWAAEICARRGWRLALYGAGWERHPDYAPHARGELEHDDDLRAAYACAAVHLHASAGPLVHQRVAECALSGGRPAALLRLDDVAELQTAERLRLLRARAPLGTHPDDPALLRFAVAGDPETERLAALCRRLRWSLDTRGEVFVRPTLAERAAGVDVDELPDAMRPDRILADLATDTFRNAVELERLVERAIDDPAARAERSAAIAARVRAVASTDALAERIVALVGDGLARAAADAPQGVGARGSIRSRSDSTAT